MLKQNRFSRALLQAMDKIETSGSGRAKIDRLFEPVREIKIENDALFITHTDGKSQSFRFALLIRNMMLPINRSHTRLVSSE